MNVHPPWSRQSLTCRPKTQWMILEWNKSLPCYLPWLVSHNTHLKPLPPKFSIPHLLRPSPESAQFDLQPLCSLMEIAPKGWPSSIHARPTSNFVQRSFWTNKPRSYGLCPTWRQDKLRNRLPVFSNRSNVQTTLARTSSAQNSKRSSPRACRHSCNPSPRIHSLLPERACSLNNYIDKFQNLIADSGYADLKTIVVKFRRDLNSQIQNAVAPMAMASGRSTDAIPSEWYSMTWTVDQNCAANEVFSSMHRPPAPPTHPVPTSVWNPVPSTKPGHSHILPTPGNPVPMDTNMSWWDGVKLPMHGWDQFSILFLQ